MDAQGIYDRLSNQFGAAVTELVTDNPDPIIWVAKESIADIGAFLKTDSELAFDYLQSISGVDTTEELHLVYHLFSYTHRHGITVKAKMGYEDLNVPTTTGVWAAADWHEREQYDLFGFVFEGHPDLRRLLLPEDWDGHPLLKAYEYPEEYHEIDHYREDPLVQFKALDDLVNKAKEAKDASEDESSNA